MFVPTARLCGALALGLIVAIPAAAQDASPPDDLAVDPSAPLPDLPGMDVAWPDAEAPATQADAPADPAEATPDAAVRYRVDTEGLADIGLATRFRELSALATSSEVENLAQLDRRARADVDLALSLLRAAGYYAATVRREVTPASAPGGQAVVQIVAAPGLRYRFASVDLDGSSEGAPAALLAELLGIKADDPVDAATIEAAEERLREGLRQRGYPFARLGVRELVVDHDTRTATYRLPVRSGAPARFGQIRLDATTLMGPRHLARIARFRPGDAYDVRLVEDLRRALVATSLFSVVTVRPEEALSDTPGQSVVDIVVATRPAPPRTVAGQAGYSTGEGIRVEASWQHRTLVRPEGALTARVVAGTQEQLVGGDLRFSNVRARDTTLVLSAAAGREDRDAYKARALSLGARIERDTNIIWQKLWTYSIGAELVTTDETDIDIVTNRSRSRTFLIAAAPGTLAYDSTDDLLDPRRGFRLAGRLSPEVSFQNSAFGYLRAQIDGSVYAPLKGDAVVAAARIRLGSIVGAARDRIAPSRRFYAGGGGSVRGFGYQDIGPRDAFNDPIGGRSLTEIAAEVRFRVFGEFGIVPFIDGGQLYTSTLPEFDSLRIGAGVGVRYYTRFGPIRVDVATPLNPQPGDAPVGVYVSIGQAF